MAGGRPSAFETVEQLETAIDHYFAVDAYVGEDDERRYLPTMSGLGVSLGVDRQTIINYGKKDEFFGTVKAARAKVEAFLEQRLYGNTVTGVIFNLKNNFGWKDKSEQEITGADGGPIETDNTWTIKVVK